MTNEDRVADIFAALANPARVRILRLLLASHPKGMIPGEIQKELEIPGSTLSHHLEKLKHEGLISVRRERQFLWYSTCSEVLQGLLSYLFAECCSRTQVIRVDDVIAAGRPAKAGRSRKVKGFRRGARPVSKTEHTFSQKE